MHASETKHFPDGLQSKLNLLKVAEVQATSYFMGMFGMEVLR